MAAAARVTTRMSAEVYFCILPVVAERVIAAAVEAKAVISPLRSNLAAYRDRDLRHGVVPVEAVPQAMRDAFREYL